MLKLKINFDNKRQLDKLYNDNTAGWYCVPTKHDIENLRVGDSVPNPFGRLGVITEISYRGIDINGLAYIGYFVTWHDDGIISDSLKENRVNMTLPLCEKYHRSECVPV
jgi:hypothetical protein